MTIQWPTLTGWPEGVRIGYTERGSSGADGKGMGFNLAGHVNDNPENVLANRELLARKLPANARLVWLDQVHGARVVFADPDASTPERADGLWTDEPGICCAVLTADCLPVMLCDRNGGRIAAIHAGWRGVVGGVLEAALAAMEVEGAEIRAWLGPAIGADAFEVGPEVRDRFMQASPGVDRALTGELFRPVAERPDHYLANLRGLAEARLRGLGVIAVDGEASCTFSEPQRFFSYRRDGATGRMATFILRTGPV